MLILAVRPESNSAKPKGAVKDALTGKAEITEIVRFKIIEIHDLDDK